MDGICWNLGRTEPLQTLQMAKRPSEPWRSFPARTVILCNKVTLHIMGLHIEPESDISLFVDAQKKSSPSIKPSSIDFPIQI